MDQFYMPVKVWEGPKAVASATDLVKSLGHKALIVTGAHSAVASGALGDVSAMLKAGQISFSLFDRVEENPGVTTIIKAAQTGHQAGVDFVIGIGGGSPLDAAKAIAFLLAHPDRDDLLGLTDEKEAYACAVRLLYQTKAGLVHPLPIVAIPTTCGTGSEVTGVSVITRTDLGTKVSLPYAIFPALALIDGAYIARAPQSLIANTATDALGHMLESYINTKADFYSRGLVEAGLSIWSRILPVLRQDRPATDEDRTLLMRASTFAGAAIAHTGTSLPHALSYRTTISCHVPHGPAIGFFEPGYLRHAKRAVCDRLLSLSGFTGLEDFTSFIEKVCHVPDLTDPAFIAARSQAFSEILANPARIAKVPYPVDENVLKDIARLS